MSSEGLEDMLLRDREFLKLLCLDPNLALPIKDSPDDSDDFAKRKAEAEAKQKVEEQRKAEAEAKQEAEESHSSSYVYWNTHKLLEQQLMEDGFFDPGRSDINSSFPSIDDVHHKEADSNREIIYVDANEDNELAEFLTEVKDALRVITGDRERAKRLAELVAERLGGDCRDIVRASGKDIARLNVKLVPIGQIRVGVCRHRAVLYKYFADRVGLRCRLVRGDYCEGGDAGGHAWNVVLLHGDPWLCDVMHKPGDLYEEGSTKATHYKRLAERGDDDSGGGAGMASINPPALDPVFAHLMNEEVPPGDLEPCVDANNKPIILGEGGFGQVMKGTLLGHGEVAVKRIRPDRMTSGMLEDFKREVVQLFSMRSPFIVQAVGFSARPEDMFLALEFMSGGSLYDALHRSDDASWLDWDVAGKRVMEHVARGLYYLHTRRPPLIHRDVKSPNVLLSHTGDRRVSAKVADVGSIKEKLQSFVSVPGLGFTPVYAPPEVLYRRKQSDARQNEKVDVFAWGVLLWEVLSKRFPNMGHLEPPRGASQNILDLFERCTDEDQKNRPSSAELIEIPK